MEDPHSDHGTVVKPDEAALIVDTDGNLKMCMPDYAEEEEVPFYVMVLTAVWLKMRDDNRWGLELAEEVFSGDE
jgi:hypothetical protein